MIEATKGWVVLTYNHAISGRAWIVTSTYARTRKESIELFIEGSFENWKFWYRKNYRCVKAQQTISTE